jgi:hypothetical protein
MQTCINREKFTFGAPKNLETGRVPSLGLEVTMNTVSPKKAKSMS